jgi:hypothetical protein
MQFRLVVLLRLLDAWRGCPEQNGLLRKCGHPVCEGSGHQRGNGVSTRVLKVKGSVHEEYQFSNSLMLEAGEYGSWRKIWGSFGSIHPLKV